MSLLAASTRHTGPMSGRLLSTSEAAAAVGWEYHHVHRLVERGTVRPTVESHGPGSRMRWSPADVALLRVLRRASTVAPTEATPFLTAIADAWRQHHGDRPPIPGSAFVVTPALRVFVMHEAEDIRRLAAVVGAVVVVAVDDVA